MLITIGNVNQLIIRISINPENKINSVKFEIDLQYDLLTITIKNNKCHVLYHVLIVRKERIVILAVVSPL